MVEQLQQFYSSHSDLIGLLGIAGLTISLIALAALPYIFTRLPADYFVSPRHKTASPIYLVILRNVVGYCCLVLGAIMLLTPGQGLLTILAGVILADIPGKQRLMLIIVRRPSIRKAILTLRKKAKQPELIIPE